MFGHKSIICYRIMQVIGRIRSIQSVFRTMGRYLPIYLLWAIFVMVGFPLIFQEYKSIHKKFDLVSP